jgi:hypothetical protein
MAKTNMVAGLDIGRYAVKVVWARRVRGQVRIVRAEKLKIPAGVNDIRPMVEPWLAKQGLAGTPCVSGLAGQQCMFQPFVLPPDDPRQSAQVASMEVIRFNEMAAEEMVYGFGATATQPGERLLLLAMARPSVLAERLDFMAAQRMAARDLIPDPLAFYHAMRGESDQRVLYVNVGHAGTDLAVGSGAGLLFARSFAAGGRRFTETLAETLDLSFGKAEDLKLTRGSLAADAEMAAPLTAAADEWIEELQSCLSVYENGPAGQGVHPQALVMGGGGSLLPGLAAYTAGKLGMTLLPAPALPLPQPQPDEAAYAVAYGLAAAGLDRNAAAAGAISLLPPEVRDEQVFRRQKPFWIAAGLAAGLILAVSIVGGMRDIRRKTDHFNTVAARLRVRDSLARESEGILAEQARLRALSEPVFKFLRAAPQMRDLITLAANSLAATDQIVMVCDAESFFGLDTEASRAAPAASTRRGLRVRRRPTAPSRAEIPQAPTFERVIIEGYTRTPNLSSVRDLIARLREAPFVEAADLLGDDALLTGQRAEVVQPALNARNFVIEVTLVPL